MHHDAGVALRGEGDMPDPVAAVIDTEVPAPDEVGLVLFFTGLSGSGKSTLARALNDVILERGQRTVTTAPGPPLLKSSRAPDRSSRVLAMNRPKPMPS